MHDESSLAIEAIGQTPPPKAKKETTRLSNPSTQKASLSRSLSFHSKNDDGGKDEDLKFWQTKAKRWQQDALLGDCLASETLKSLAPDACQRAKETWLVGTKSGLLCIACQDAKMAGCWSKGTAGADAQDFSRWRLAKHTKSKAHVAAVGAYLNVSTEPLGAPPFSDFKKVLESAQDGSSLRATNEFKAWSDKTELMIWALQEALLNETRSQLESAATISLTRDARRQRLFVRYGLCNDDFKLSSGVLGLARDEGDRAGNILRATRKLLARVCTKFACPPRWYNGPEPELLTDLLEHVQSLGFL